MDEKPTQESLTDAFQGAMTPKVAGSSWLFFAYSDAPPAVCGAGIGAFHWFDDRIQMLEFVRTSMAWFHPGPSSMDASEIAADIRRVVDSMETTIENLPAIRETLNGFMERLWQIPWWGTFQQFAESDDEFPTDIRARYREDSNQPVENPSTAIPKEDWHNFGQWLSEYGL